MPRTKSKKQPGPQKSRSPKAIPLPDDIQLTNPQRVLYPDSGVTKQELAEYYVQVAEWILPHLVERPLTLVRCPRGSKQKCFFQKHLTESLPESLRGIDIQEEGGVAQYVAIDDLSGLIALVQMSVLEIHPWGSREDKLEYPDRMVLDLDPGPGIEWPQLVNSANEIRRLLERLELESFIRTTGGKGLHLVVPLDRRAPWDLVKGFAEQLANLLAQQDPSLYVDTSSKAKRNNRIYVDYLRNARGATAIASYSSRAKAGAPVATPLEWSELSPKLDPAALTVRTVPQRLQKIRNDPWKGFTNVRQNITQSMMKTLTSGKAVSK